MKFIIYDLEIYKFDFLMGCKIRYSDGTHKYVQMWDRKSIVDFYNENRDDSIFIGHNNFEYDDLVLEAILAGMNPYVKSKSIIEAKWKPKCKLDFLSYDLMSEKPYSLKLSELLVGKNIHETDVDFDIGRKLTDKEKELVELYNRDDLDQTDYNFQMFYNNFKLKLDIAKEFNLDLKYLFHCSGTSMAAEVLGAKKNDELVNQYYAPPKLENLRVNDEEIKDWYFNEKFREGKEIKRVYGKCEVKLAKGGAHGAIENSYWDKALYFDVSGYYNLIMINLDLLSRSLPKEAKEKYEYMYHEQLKMKKSNPRKRAVFKTVLLTVFGAQMNEHCDFYDPWKGSLVPVTGEIFLIDLIEKLEGLVTVIQYNTDGIIVYPNDWNDEQKIISIVEEWEARTGFVIKKDHIFNIWQRDVNKYIYFDDKNNLHYVGFTNYDISDEGYASGKLFGSTNPPIITKGLIDMFAYGKSPVDTVNELKQDLRYFQFPCRKVSADYMVYETLDVETGEIKEEKTQKVCRAFAYKNEKIIGKLYKYRKVKKDTKSLKAGDLQKVSYSAMPNNIFIYNESIIEEDSYDKLKNKIDYQWYIDEIIKESLKFVGVKENEIRRLYKD